MKTNKELKAEYKLYKSPKGVYQIKNLKNGKIFIGSSSDLKAIWNRHQAQLNFGSHPNIELQKDWKELGKDNFEYSILTQIKEKDEEPVDIGRELKDLELLYLDELQPFGNRGYNKRSKTN